MIRTNLLLSGAEETRNSATKAHGHLEQHEYSNTDSATRAYETAYELTRGPVASISTAEMGMHALVCGKLG